MHGTSFSSAHFPMGTLSSLTLTFYKPKEARFLLPPPLLSITFSLNPFSTSGFAQVSFFDSSKEYRSSANLIQTIMEGLLCLFFLLSAMTGRSGATYCLCKDGLNDTELQKTLDYACGSGADCSPILQNGSCYLPNTIKDHCCYAANSYYQRKSSSGATCDFSGTAYTSQTPPTNVAFGCLYPSSSSTVGSAPPPPPPSSTTNSNTTYNTPPYTTGISPGDSGSGRGTIGLFNAVAALAFWLFGHLVWAD